MAKRGKTSKTNEGNELVIQQYKKERERILRFIRTARSRQYDVSEIVVPKIPKKIKEGSVRRLQRITNKSLYSKTTALSEEGKIISGTQKLAETRHLAIVKGAETRRANLERVSAPSTTFEERQRATDLANITRLQTDTAYREDFTEAELTYQGILSICYDTTQGFPRSRAHVLDLLQREYSSNRDGFLRRLASEGKDVKAVVQYAIMYDINTPQHRGAMRALEELIINRPLSMQEAKESEDLYECDYTW